METDSRLYSVKELSSYGSANQSNSTQAFLKRELTNSSLSQETWITELEGHSGQELDMSG